jgi:hypothetical protein
MTAEWRSVGNKVGQVAPNVIPPGLPPAGSYNASNGPAYKFSPNKAAQLLLDAMAHPITTFHFVNGTKAPRGFFNNTFGCRALSSGKCVNPVQQSVTLTYPAGDTVDEAVFNDMALTLNNISLTYNMGLTVAVAGEPAGTMVTQAFSPPSPLFMYALGWFDDYPWVIDFTLNMYNYPGTYPGGMGFNITAMTQLYKLSVQANQQGNIPLLIKYTNQMNALANKMVMYLWTFTGSNYITMTSNVQGFYWNTNGSPGANGGVGPEYFASLY